jgi:hypothetical protein
MVVPYTMTVMAPINRQLQEQSQAGDKSSGEEGAQSDSAHALLDKWATLNLVRLSERCWLGMLPSTSTRSSVSGRRCSSRARTAWVDVTDGTARDTVPTFILCFGPAMCSSPLVL